MVGILTSFWLATTEKEAIEEMLQKNLQEVTSLKGQLLQLQNSNRQDALTIQHL
jgi:hypothetical protein